MLEQSQQALNKLKEQNTPFVHLEKTLVIEGQNTLSKKHIFRINNKDRVLFTEAFEYVTGLQSEETIRQSLCLPTAIGCTMACRICDLGTFYGGELPKEAIIQMIERVVDTHTVGWKNPSHIQISYLGGGEPAYNKDILKVLWFVSQKYSGCSQVLSTVGIDNDFNDRFTDLARDMNVGFQISVHCLDDNVRNYIVNIKKILNAGRCLNVLEKYHASTGRQGRMAIVLLEGMNLDKINQQIEERVDKEAIHISLQTISKSSTGFPHRTKPLTQYELLRARLESSGYSVSIYNPPGLEFRGSCGVASDNLLARVTPYKKRPR
ncbi:MAG: radical SAM protein [Candidatus Woesearchaeota archaeon]